MPQNRLCRAVAMAIVALALGAAARRGAPSRPAEPLLGKEFLEKYRADPECRGSVFHAVQTTLTIEELDLAAARHVGDARALEAGQIAASDYNKVAQIAADKGCPDVARELWLDVIEKFIGSGYAAMRQRAQIGIDDLRAAARSEPAISPERTPQ